MERKKTELGELRQDIVTGKWVVIATTRAKRPNDLAEKEEIKPRLVHYKEDCPFCNLIDNPQEPDLLRLPDTDEDWQVHIFANKYPAFVPGDEVESWNMGPYRVLSANGYHELLATRWHDQSEALNPVSTIELQLEAFVLRYRQLKTKPAVNYIQIIRNYGAIAGASQEHPHNQIFTTPVLPSDVHDMLHGAEYYAQREGRDPFTALLEFELAEGTRIVWENEHFVVLCPFASRVPFETWIVPREPEPFFENLDAAHRTALAEAMQQVFRRLAKGLHDPAYNYFIYSAPCDDTGIVCNREAFQHYRWHLAITPRFGSWGGFEMATSLEINPTLPEEAAEFLREVVL